MPPENDAPDAIAIDLYMRGRYEYGNSSHPTTVRAIADTMMALSTDAFEYTTTHDLSFFDQYASGKILSRITNDTREFGQLVTLVSDLVSQMIQSITLSIVLVRIDWRLSLYVFALIPVAFTLAILYRRLARPTDLCGRRALG